MQKFNLPLFVKLLKGATFLSSMVFLILFMAFYRQPQVANAIVSPEKVTTIRWNEGFNYIGCD